MIKHHDQKQLAEDKVDIGLKLSGHIPSWTEIRTSTPARKECGGKNSSRSHDRMMLIGLLFMIWSDCILTELRMTKPGIALPTMS